MTAFAAFGISPTGAALNSPEVREGILDIVENGYGEGRSLDFFAPSLAGDERFRTWWARYERAAGSPRVARMFFDFALRVDVAPILPTIRVPTLLLHRTGDRIANIEEGRRAAELIPGARLVELDGDDNLTYGGDPDEVLDAVQEFFTGARRDVVVDRVLSTVLFTDIVASTELASELGDRRWRELLDRHDELVRRQLARYGGREVKTTGDGFLAAFDGPARAVACADAIADGIRDLGIRIRAGVHTGECERRGDDLGGVAVHIGARIVASADPGEVLVSSTVRDLVVGSGLRFEDRGARPLKGVPDEWRLFALAR